MYTDFTQMPVWKLSMDFAVEIFNLTQLLPKKEDYGLTSQLRRAALSISSNIAEAYGRQHNGEKIHFYLYARGSSFESKNQLIYGNKVGYFDKEIIEVHISTLHNIIESLNKLMKSFRNT